MIKGSSKKVIGVLLAGGLARRMGGGDKCLRILAGRPLLDRLIDVVKPQVDIMILNANGDATRFANYGLPVVADVIEGYAGPLAGVLTGLEWAAENIPDAAWVASLATDAPFLPGDLVARMISAVKSEGADLACAASVGRMHPVFGLWPLSLRADLRAAMIDEDIRKIDFWTARYNLAVVEFEKKQGRDPFFNVNQPDNLAEAGRIIAGPG
jgi:molybdopterin-guanine dinucleotide biosynthesis protein A